MLVICPSSGEGLKTQEQYIALPNDHSCCKSLPVQFHTHWHWFGRLGFRWFTSIQHQVVLMREKFTTFTAGVYSQTGTSQSWQGTRLVACAYPPWLHDSVLVRPECDEFQSANVPAAYLFQSIKIDMHSAMHSLQRISRMRDTWSGLTKCEIQRVQVDGKFPHCIVIQSDRIDPWTDLNDGLRISVIP